MGDAKEERPKGQRAPRRSRAVKSALAERLDRVARRAGLTSEAIAERLDVTPGAVGHWRSGAREPDIETVQRIARIVGESDYYLLTGRLDPAWLLAQVPAALEEFREAVLRGEEPAAAWERVMGRSDVLTAEQRALLESDAEGLREYLASPAGETWSVLTAEEQQAVLHLVRLLGKGRRSNPEPELG